MKKPKFYKVYYRCKANGNGIVYAVKIEKKGGKHAAIRATHIYMSMSDRTGYYAPVAYSITEQDFNEHKTFNQGKEHIRW